MICVAVCVGLAGFALALVLDLFCRNRWMARHARVESQCQRYVAELAHLRGEGRRLESLADSLDRRFDHAEKRAAEVAEQLAQAHAHAECHRQAANVHCERADVLRGERDTAREIVEEVIGERNVFREHAQALEDDNARLRLQLDEARQREADAEAGWRECEGRFTALDAVLAQVTAERDQALADLQACRELASINADEAMRFHTAELAGARAQCQREADARHKTAAELMTVSTAWGREKLRASKVADELSALAESLRRRPE